MKKIDFIDDIDFNNFPPSHDAKEGELIIAVCDWKIKQTQVIKKGDIFKVSKKHSLRPRKLIKSFYINKNEKYFKIHSSRFRIFPIYDYKIKNLNNILEKL